MWVGIYEKVIYSFNYLFMSSLEQISIQYTLYARLCSKFKCKEDSL